MSDFSKVPLPESGYDQQMITAALLLAFTQAPVSPDRPAILAAIQKLDFIVGEWEGEGWHLINGKRETSRVKEVVKVMAGGTVLAIQGQGKRSDGEVVHDAFAVLNYDPKSKEYRFRSFLGTGNTGEFIAHVKDKTLIWEMNNERQIRYTITLDAQGRWFEFGEVNMGERGWMKFMEMTLTKKG